MSSDMMNQAVLTLGEHKVKVPPLYVITHCQNQLPVDNVKRAMYIPILLNGKGDYYANATGFGDHKIHIEPSPYLFFLQLLMLVCEYCHTFGGYECSVDPDTTPALYDEIVWLTVLCKVGVANSQQSKKQKDYVQRTKNFDLRFAHDIEYEEKRYRWNLKQKESEGGGKPKKKAKKKEDSWVKWCKKREMDPELIASYCTRTRASEETRDEEIEDENGKKFEDEYPKEPFVGNRNRIPKIDFVLSTIVDAADPTTKTTGLLAQFLVHDPSLNPGIMFRNILNNVGVRHSANKPQRFVDMFSNYMELFRTSHPVGDRTTLHNYATCIQQLIPDIVNSGFDGKRNRYMTECDFINDKPTHLYNVLTIDRALDVLQKAGGLTGNTIDWWDQANGIANFPTQTFKYPIESVFWNHPTRVSMREYYFPHLYNGNDFLKALCSGADMASYMKNGGRFASEAEAERAKHNIFSSIDSLLTNNPVVVRNLITGQKNLGYETGNEFVHMYEETKIIYDNLDKYFPATHYKQTLKTVQGLVKRFGQKEWRRYLDGDPKLKKQVEECELYNELLKTTQQHRMKAFTRLWQTDGDIDTLPISDAVKACLRWYRDNHAAKFPHLTRKYVTMDKDLDPFGNTMIKQIGIYVYIYKILQPLICMLTEGLYSCYDAKRDILRFNMILLGPGGTGKSFTAIKIQRDFTFIHDTTTLIQSSTKAAGTTRRHVYDRVVLSDECPDWLIDPKEAKLHVEEVGEKKLKMVDGQVSRDVFVNLKLLDGNNIRYTEKITTDHYEACLYCSNGQKPDREALSSRFLIMTMKQNNIPAQDLQLKIPSTLVADSKEFFRINHFLSVCGRKAAGVGAILPDPEMGIFDSIAKKFVSHLKSKKSITDAIGKRSLDIVEPYARQLVYKMAIRYAFDCTWSDNFEKKFTTERIAAIQPFLYITTSQVWWAFTSCASEFIDEDYENVLQALMIEAGCKEKWQDSNYSEYEKDVNNKIPWRTRKNNFFDAKNMGPDDVVGDDLMIDINYISIPGSHDSVAERVAKHTHPTMSPEQVKNTFKLLSKHLIDLDYGGYAEQPRGRMKKWHQYDEHGHKLVMAGCPHVYGHDSDSRPRTEDDMPKLAGDGARSRSLVDLSNTHCVSFLPNTARHFSHSVIIEALLFATTCATTRPGKYLTGFTNPENTTQFEIFKMSQELRDRMIGKIDSANGYDEKGRYIGQGKPEHAPVSRRKGIGYNIRAAMTSQESVMFCDAAMAPKPKDDPWEERYKSATDSMSATQEIIEDLDVESATRQHIRCGRPLDEPVRTPAWIMEKMGSHHMGLNYPDNQKEIRIHLEKGWKNLDGDHKLTSSIWEEMTKEGFKRK